MTTLDAWLFSLEAMRQVLKCKPYDIRVCCSPNHKPYWYYRDKQFLCAVCQRLEPEIQRIDSKIA